MTPNEESDLKEAIVTLMQRYKMNGFILGYLDSSNKLKFTGEMGMSVLVNLAGPLLVKAFAEKFK